MFTFVGPTGPLSFPFVMLTCSPTEPRNVTRFLSMPACPPILNQPTVLKPGIFKPGSAALFGPPASQALISTGLIVPPLPHLPKTLPTIEPIASKIPPPSLPVPSPAFENSLAMASESELRACSSPLVTRSFHQFLTWPSSRCLAPPGFCP